MVVSNKNICLTITLLIFFCFGVKAQHDKEKQPLTDVLTGLQERYDYQFNYAEDTVENITLQPLQETLSFEEVMAHLRKQTGLIFTILDNNIVSVKQKTAFFLCGYLKDNNTHEPLAYAAVEAENNATISDENGYFELNVDRESEEINISYLGFKALRDSFTAFKKGACGDIYLVPQQEMLSEIIVSDYLVRGIDKLNDGSFVIDFSNFTILPGLIEADVLHSVQALPGIQSVDETVSNINIRGGSHDQNLILWDGIKMYQSGHFFGLISIFNSHMTKKISLQKNGIDVSHNDGISGIISMETDKSVNHDFKGNIGINLTDINGFLDIPVGEKSSAQIALRKSLNDMVETPAYKEYFRRIIKDTELETNSQNTVNSAIKFGFYDMALRWLYAISDKDEIRLNLIHARNQLISEENVMIDDDEEFWENSLTQNSAAAGIHYKRTWNDALQTVFQIYKTDYKLKTTKFDMLYLNGLVQKNRVWETGIKLNFLYKVTDRLSWHNGYGFVENGTNLSNLGLGSEHVGLLSYTLRNYIHSAYSQARFVSENRKTLFKAGLRFNFDTFEKLRIEPGISFSHKFMDRFTVEVLGGLKHQNTFYIANFKNDFLGIEKHVWRLPFENDEITAIIGKHVSLGLHYDKNGWLISTEGYFKNVSGIRLSYNTSKEGAAYLNHAFFANAMLSYRASGVDFLVRKKIKRSDMWLSYSYMDNKYIFSDVYPDLIGIPFPSDFEISHAVTFGATYTSGNFKVSAGFNWHSGKQGVRPEIVNNSTDSSINYGLVNNSRLSDYFRVDVSSLYQFKIGAKSKAHFGVSVWNLFNRDNPINSFYRFNSNDEAEEVVQNALKLTPNAVFRIYF